MTRKVVSENNILKINHNKSLLCLFLCFIMLLFSSEMKVGALQGINLSIQTLIPTLFPFFILSDYWSANFTIKEEGAIAKLFEKIFHLPPCTLSAIMTGMICGFPLGVKTACDLYHQGRINENELTRLSGICNNPSIAFVISGVGLGLFGSLKIGIYLFISSITSALICGIIFRGKKSQPQYRHDILKQNFILSRSIKSAGISSITVSSFVIFFSSMIYALDSVIKLDFIMVCVATLIELCSAVSRITEALYLPENLRLILIAFSLGFSGLSVHMQAFSFMPRETNKGLYFIIKMLQGALSAIIMSAILSI